jgi:pyruvate/2-oxoacid:ferredoxin oxidoreductase alpha subunit
MLWEYRTDDADLILVGMGSLASEAMDAADRLRESGIAAGIVGIRSYRPFPKAEARNAFRNAKGIVIFEKSISYGYEGGLCSDLKAAFYGTAIRAPIHNYIVGLGGRDVKARELAAAAKESLAGFEQGIVEPKTTWLNTITG